MYACFLVKCHSFQIRCPLVSGSAPEGGRTIGDVVVLNVGGTIHQVRWDTIDKFPNSRLQKLRYATSECELSCEKYREL